MRNKKRSVNMNLLSKSKLSFTECQKIMSENGGTLNLYYSDVEELPDNLYVSGNVVLTGSKITKLPENLEIKGDLYMEHCNIEEIPSSISVGGAIHASDSTLKKLPERLKVGGSLFLSKTHVEMIPDSIKSINGSLVIESTAINALPKDLVVAESLVATNSALQVLPEGLKVGCTLDIRNTNITALPDLLLVGLHLRLDPYYIRKVGEIIIVGGFLEFNGDIGTSLQRFAKIAVGCKAKNGFENDITKSLGLSVKPDPRPLRMLNSSITYLAEGECNHSRYLYSGDRVTLIKRVYYVDDHLDTHDITDKHCSISDDMNYILYEGLFDNQCVIRSNNKYVYCTDLWDGLRKVRIGDVVTPSC